MAFGKEEVCAYLDSRGVVYDRVDHEAVFTMEAMDALSLPFANVVVKNLFLRDDKKRNYYLVVMPEDKPANLKALRAALGARPLRFASETSYHFVKNFFRAAQSEMTPTVELARPGRPLPSGDGPPHRTR